MSVPVNCKRKKKKDNKSDYVRSSVQINLICRHESQAFLSRIRQPAATTTTTTTTPATKQRQHNNNNNQNQEQAKIKKKKQQQPHIKCVLLKLKNKKEKQLTQQEVLSLLKLLKINFQPTHL